MLSKNDLQQIRTVIQEETRPIVKEEIGVALKPVKAKLNKLHRDFHKFVDHFDSRLTTVESDIKILKQN